MIGLLIIFLVLAGMTLGDYMLNHRPPQSDTGKEWAWTLIGYPLVFAIFPACGLIVRGIGYLITGQ